MSSSIFASVTATRVRERRERLDISLFEARRDLMAEAAHQTILDLHAEGVINHRLQQLLTWLADGRR